MSRSFLVEWSIDIEPDMFDVDGADFIAAAMQAAAIRDDSTPFYRVIDQETGESWLIDTTENWHEYEDDPLSRVHEHQLPDAVRQKTIFDSKQ